MRQTLSQPRLACKKNTRGLCRLPESEAPRSRIRSRRRPSGTPPPPRAVRAMNGQLGFSGNRRHPSPDRGPPALLPSQGGSRRTAEANKPQGACLTQDEGAAPGAERGGRHRLHRTPPPPGAQAAARVGTVTLRSWGTAGGARAPES